MHDYRFANRATNEAGRGGILHAPGGRCRREGWRTGACGKRPGELLPEIAALGGEHIPFPADSKNWLAWPGIARQLSKLIADENVDLVHVGSRVPGWLAVLARRKRHFPLVMNYHGAYSQNVPLKSLYNRVMTLGDVCLASSRFTKQIVAERHDIAPEKLVRIWLGIDPTQFDPNEVSRSSARPRCGHTMGRHA